MLKILIWNTVFPFINKTCLTLPWRGNRSFHCDWLIIFLFLRSSRMLVDFLIEAFKQDGLNSWSNTACTARGEILNSNRYNLTLFSSSFDMAVIVLSFTFEMLFLLCYCIHVTIFLKLYWYLFQIRHIYMASLLDYMNCKFIMIIMYQKYIPR